MNLVKAFPVIYGNRSFVDHFSSFDWRNTPSIQKIYITDRFHFEKDLNLDSALALECPHV